MSIEINRPVLQAQISRAKTMIRTFTRTNPVMFRIRENPSDVNGVFSASRSDSLDDVVSACCHEVIPVREVRQLMAQREFRPAFAAQVILNSSMTFSRAAWILDEIDFDVFPFIFKEMYAKQGEEKIADIVADPNFEYHRELYLWGRIPSNRLFSDEVIDRIESLSHRDINSRRARRTIKSVPDLHLSIYLDHKRNPIAKEMKDLSARLRGAPDKLKLAASAVCSDNIHEWAKILSCDEILSKEAASFVKMAADIQMRQRLILAINNLNTEKAGATEKAAAVVSQLPEAEGAAICVGLSWDVLKAFNGFTGQ